MDKKDQEINNAITEQRWGFRLSDLPDDVDELKQELLNAKVTNACLIAEIERCEIHRGLLFTGCPVCVLEDDDD